MDNTPAISQDVEAYLLESAIHTGGPVVVHGAIPVNGFIPGANGRISCLVTYRSWKTAIRVMKGRGVKDHPKDGHDLPLPGTHWDFVEGVGSPIRGQVVRVKRTSASDFMVVLRKIQTPDYPWFQWTDEEDRMVAHYYLDEDGRDPQWVTEPWGHPPAGSTP